MDYGFKKLKKEFYSPNSRRQHSPLLRPAGPATRAGAGRHGATGLLGRVSSATSPCERWSQFLSDAVWCFNGLNQHSRWSGRGTLIFRHDTGRQFLSGCTSLHQAPRISCPLDLSVTICHCGECYSLFHSTLLEGDRAPRGRSLLPKKLRRKTFTFVIAILK